MLTDIYLLIARNLTMSALCIAYGLALWQLPLGWLLGLPGFVHVASALITNGDLQLRKTRPVLWAYGWTLLAFIVLVIVGVVKYHTGSLNSEPEPEVFNYVDVLKFLFDWYAGVSVLGCILWVVATNNTFVECCNATGEAVFESRESLMSAVAIGSIIAFMQATGCDLLLSAYLFAGSAWVLRYVLKTPPERKARTVLATATH